MPAIILGGIYGGIFTPTEAAGVAVIYGFIVSMFIYREITFKDLTKILLDSAITAAGILLIISTANLFGLIMAREMIPQKLAEAFVAISSNNAWNRPYPLWTYNSYKPGYRHGHSAFRTKYFRRQRHSKDTAKETAGICMAIYLGICSRFAHYYIYTPNRIVAAESLKVVANYQYYMMR